MKIKIKDPKESIEYLNLIWFCVALCIILPSAFLVFQFATVTSRILLCILIAIVLSVAVFIFHSTRKEHEQRKKQGRITALDFQPTAVILQGNQYRTMMYAETWVHLAIHIRQEFRDKLKVSAVSFFFQSGDEQLRLKHLTNFKKLFSILEQCRRFSKFTYDFAVETSGDDEEQYKAFVEEQIQNHLRYGVHLPFPSETMKYYMSFVISYFSAFCFALYFGTDYMNETSLFYRLAFLSFFIFMGGLIAALLLIPFHRAKHQLDKFRLDEFRRETFLKDK